MGFPDGSVDKEASCKARDTGDVSLIPESGRSPGGKKWQPTPVFLPGKFHGQRSLEGYTPGRHKESDTTEHMAYTDTDTYVYIYIHTYIHSFLYSFPLWFIPGDLI